MARKRKGKKQLQKAIWKQNGWTLKPGCIVRGESGGKVAKDHLFKMLAEKLPFDSIKEVEAHVKSEGIKPNGIYLAHDSMGCPRYIGRGAIFTRLKAHLKRHPLELAYFSFYIVENKRNEREIETLAIRSASYLTVFNERKVQSSIEPGNILDYEVGTRFVERQRTKGKKRKK